MATENQVMNVLNDLTPELLENVYFGALYNIAFVRKRSWFSNRIPRDDRNAKGLRIDITFLKDYGWPWRPMDAATGFTPAGDKLVGEDMFVQLKAHAATAQVNLETIAGTDGSFSRIGSIIDRSMRGLLETFPYYIRAMLWSPESGVLGSTSGAAAALVVTLTNTGLPNINILDRARYFEPGMVVQVYTSAQAKRGGPVKIDAVDKTLGTITLASDPGVASGDLFVLSDVGGLEDVIGGSSPGIFDVIDDDNTFQTIDRSLATNSKFRSVINANGGTPRALTRDLLTTFLHDVYDPEFAFTTFEVVRDYWTQNFKGDTRYSQNMDAIDGYKSVQVGVTNLVEDDDAHVDKIIVPDLGRMLIADKGNVQSLFNMGWEKIPGRPIMEYPLVYWALLMATDTRHMGVLDDLNVVT